MPGDAHVAAELAEVLDRRAHVVGHVERLQVVRADDDDLLAHVAGDGQPEAAAHHVAEEVEEDEVEAPVVEAELLERLEAVDDAAPAAAAAHLGAAQLHGEHAVALEAHVADAHGLAGELLPRADLDDGRARPAAEEQRRGVALRVAADEEDLLPLLRHHVAQVGQREALADAALAVDGDDLRLLGGRRRGHRRGLDRRLGAEPRGELHEAVARRRRGHHVRRQHGRGHARGRDAHGYDLQSRTILTQAASSKAAW
jgi:hypothetical protein